MWKPVHEAHAIERVRVFVPFAETVPMKAVAKAGEHVIANHREFGFDVSEVASPQEQQIVLQIIGNARPQMAANEGYVLKRLDGGEVIEEVAFRSGRLGYVTTSYGRWATLESRLRELFEPALLYLSPIVALGNLTVEYWDAFIYDGELLEADARNVFSDARFGIPEGSQGPGQFWHSHCGWFEFRDGERFLVNRNISVAPKDAPDQGRQTCGLKMHIRVELRSESEEILAENAFDIVRTMHNISNTVFGEIISDQMRDRIGLDLKEYQ